MLGVSTSSLTKGLSPYGVKSQELQNFPLQLIFFIKLYLPFVSGLILQRKVDMMGLKLMTMTVAGRPFYPFKRLLVPWTKN